MAKKKPTFILIPGMHGSDKFFVRQIEELSRFGKVLTVTFLQSGKQTLESLGRRVIEKSDSVKGPLVLVGHSTGAAVALSVLPALEKRALGVVLINSGTSVQLLSGGAKSLAKVMRILPKSAFKAFSSISSPLQNNFLCVNKAALKTRNRISGNVPPAVMAERLEALASYTPDWDKIESLNAEVLIVASLLDFIAPSFFEAIRLRSKLASSKIYIEFMHGHDCLIEKGFKISDAASYHHFLPQVFDASADDSIYT